MKIHQSAELSDDPAAAMEVATKRYVDNKVAAGGAGLFITDVSPSSAGIVSGKTYVPGTVPANVVMTEATSDTQSVRVSFMVEGGAMFYSPTVTVDTIPGPGMIATIVESSTDKRTYTGYADILVTANREITVQSSTGTTAIVTVKRAAAAPEIQSLTIGSYPGSQTAVKQNDLMSVTGVVENTAVSVELLGGVGAVKAGTYTTASGGATLGAVDSGGVGFKTFSIPFTVSGLSGSQKVSAKAKNTFGSYGGTFLSDNSVTLDQIFPTIGTFTITYPVGQSALRLNDSASIACTVLNFSSITYSTGTGLSVVSPTTYASPKVVTLNDGTYSFGVNNYTIAAYKASNASTTTASTAIAISAVAPSISFAITGNPSRLITSPTGVNYTVTLTSTQRLLAAPVVTVTSGVITAFTGSGQTWIATLNVDDTDPVGAHAFNATSLVTLSNVTYADPFSETGQWYNVGGFVSRTITVGALERVVDIGVFVSDPTKVQIKYAGTTDDLMFRAEDLTQFQKGWSVVDGASLVYTEGTEPFQNYSTFMYTTNPTSWVYLTDANLAGGNTSGTLQITVGENA